MIPFREQKVVLPYANWKYTISVRLRSPIANKSEEFWSDPAVAEIITDSRGRRFHIFHACFLMLLTWLLSFSYNILVILPM